MPTPTKGHRLGGSPAHQRHILSNLASALFEHGRITTTHAKARRLRPVAERLITFAKRGDLHARRQVLTVVQDKTVVHTLFTEIGPAFATRQGGYTRITKIGARKGDNAPMAVIELVRDDEVATPRRRARRSQPPASTAAAPAATATAAPAETEAEGAATASAAEVTEPADAAAEPAAVEDTDTAEPVDAVTETTDAEAEPADAEAADAEPADAEAASAAADAGAETAAADQEPKPAAGETGDAATS